MTKDGFIRCFCAVLSHPVVSDSLRPHGLQPTRLLCPRGFSRQEYCSGLPCPPPGDVPNPGTEPRSAALQADSLPSEPPGNPENTGVGSLSFPRWCYNSSQRQCPHVDCHLILKTWLRTVSVEDAWRIRSLSIFWTRGCRSSVSSLQVSSVCS